MSNRNRKLVPFTLGPVTALINTREINNWTKHHGTTAAGVKVNSASTATIGESTVIDTGQVQFSMLSADLEVMAAGVLTGLGYTISAPSIDKAS